MYKNYNHNYPYYEIEHATNFKEVLEQAPAKANGRPAFRYKKGDSIVDVSYEQYYEDTKALGSAIASYGFADKHVAMIGPSSYEWLTVYLTMLNATGVFVPIDKELPFEEIMHIVNDSDTEMFFYAGFYAKNVRENREKMPNVKYFVNLDAKEDDGEFLAYCNVLEKGRALRAEGYTEYTDMTPSYEDMKMIVYTSGTTGRAKGVMLSLKNLTKCACHGLEVASYAGTGLSVLPYHHTYESVCGILVGLKVASTICINENLRTVAANMKLYKPDYILLVPLFLESFYKKIWANIEDQGKGDLVRKMIKVSNKLLKVGIDMRPVFFKSINEVFGGNLKKIVCGGAPFRKELGDFFEAVGITVLNGYGITECSPLVSCNRDFYRNFTSVGNPLPCLDMKIFEPNEDGEGEICVKGPTVMLGYYKQPEMTAQVLEEDGWFHTGDYGYIGKDGRLYITGRKKNLIVLKNGKNIYPEEIEEYLANASEVEEVIVSAIEGEEGAEIGLSAEIYPGEALVKELSDEDLYKLLKSAVEKINDGLPSYKRVTKVVVRKTAFEKTTSGKIRRKYAK